MVSLDKFLEFVKILEDNKNNIAEELSSSQAFEFKNFLQNADRLPWNKIYEAIKRTDAKYKRKSK